MPFGFLDTQYIDFPANIDLAYIQGLRNRAGVEFPRLLREIDSRIGALNGGLDSFVASIITPTTEAFSEQTAPVQFAIDERSEYTVARPQFAEGQATMLPIRSYDVSVAFTEEGLMRMRMERILLQIDSVIAGFRKLYRVVAMRRLFDNAVYRVDKKTTATSPAFAGSGTGLDVFSRPYPSGAPLPGGYTHYYRADATALSATLTLMRDQLKKWQMGPFDLVGSTAAIALVVADGKFVKAGSPLVRLGDGQSEALVDPAVYLGVWDNDVRVRLPLDDFTETTLAMYKSFGNLNANNPLAWRYDAEIGRAAYLRYRSLFPLDQAVVLQDFGVGVNNRTAAALLTIAASGPYTPPVIN